MNKQLKITVIICVLVVLATAGGLWWYDTKKKTGTPSKTDGTSTSGSETPTGTVSVFPLSKGSVCEEVRKLQAKMNGWMSYNYFTLTTKPSSQQLSTDAIFGKKTLEFVRIIFKTDVVTEANYQWLMAQNIDSIGKKPIWQIF
jgi:hypothetical protein